jgi:hypothetical protein
MASVKKPKQKGKNRLFIGECFGMTMSPKVVKTWGRGWVKHFEHGGKIANYSAPKDKE